MFQRRKKNVNSVGKNPKKKFKNKKNVFYQKIFHVVFSIYAPSYLPILSANFNMRLKSKCLLFSKFYGNSLP